MVVWKDPKYIKLKEQTAGEALWRRLTATVLVFISIMVGFSIGAIVGVYIVATTTGDISNLSQIWNLEMGLKYIVGAIVIALPLAISSYLIWFWAMKKSKFVSERMIKRIVRYGPY